MPRPSYDNHSTSCRIEFGTLLEVAMLKIVHARQTISGALNLESVARWILVLTNKERGRLHLSPVQRNTKLDQVAAFHSANMATIGFFSHEDHVKRSPQDRLQLLHPELIGSVGENIAKFPVDSEENLARELVQGW